MKYRKHMEEFKVTEWDTQYLDYKGGKKRAKEICNAIPSSAKRNNRQFNPVSTLLHRKTGFQKIKEDDEDVHATSPASPRQPPSPQKLKKVGTFAASAANAISPIMKRMTTKGRKRKTPKFQDTTEVHAKAEEDFTKWLMGELDKIETFYKLKEDEALARFRALEEQLVIMERMVDSSSYGIGYGGFELILRKRTDDAPQDAPRSVKYREQRADYERSPKSRKPINKPADQAVRRLLKNACTEYYRRLELLRSYVTMNREGLRKITKKFDKQSGHGMSGKYMNNVVLRSYFAGPDNQLDNLMNGTELLVAKFFYANDRRKAALHLRTRGNKSDHHASLLRSGIYLGAAFIIGDYAIVEAVMRMYDTKNTILAERTKFVMKLWAGIALILLQALLFAINLRVWARNKINYSFIFEFDPRYHLNHRQFLEIPAFLFFMFSVCLWFSVNDFWPQRLDMIHFPLIYVGLVGVILFNPFKIFFGSARMYFLNTMWRLALSGFYNVEFKDFWLGDMASSQGYALSQIYLFFCLYARAWNQPGECIVDHLQLWGLVGALPAFWRFIQCFRRWRDSGSWFPHLPNAAKYLSVMAYYAMMNLWRTDKDNHIYRALFVAAAVLSSCIGCFWDVVMDWSLLNPYAAWPYLRNELFFKSPWVYYFAIVSDILLRFTWIIYLVLAREKAFSPLINFGIAFGEVFRRFIWCFFRMENEHKGNVEAMRAYRDPKLPYRFKDSAPPPTPTITEEAEQPLLSADKTDVEAAASSEFPKRVGTLHRIGKKLTDAHRGDYERKRPKAEDDNDDDRIDEHPDEDRESDSDSDSDDESLKKHYQQHVREVSRERSRSRSRGPDAGESSSGSESHDRDSSEDHHNGRDRLVLSDRRG